MHTRSPLDFSILENNLTAAPVKVDAGVGPRERNVLAHKVGVEWPVGVALTTDARRLQHARVAQLACDEIVAEFGRELKLVGLDAADKVRRCAVQHVHELGKGRLRVVVGGRMKSEKRGKESVRFDAHGSAKRMRTAGPHLERVRHGKFLRLRKALANALHGRPQHFV